MTKILIGITVTFDDWLINKSKIINSVSNLTQVNSFFGSVLLVVQGDKSIIQALLDAPSYYQLIISNERGVSRARNEVLDFALEHNFNYVLFHDATAYYSKCAGAFFCSNSSSYTKKIEQHYSEYFNELGNRTRLYKANPIYQTYIGSYLLDVRYVYHKFDEKIGPGSSKGLYSGEDVLFLFQYFQSAGGFFVEELVGGGCFHPPRSKDYSKHLLYAKGQGVLYRVLLKSFFSFRLLKDFLLFCGNSFFRVLLLKRNSIKILKYRIKGFIYGK